MFKSSLPGPHPSLTWYIQSKPETSLLNLIYQTQIDPYFLNLIYPIQSWNLLTQLDISDPTLLHPSSTWFFSTQPKSIRTQLDISDPNWSILPYFDISSPNLQPRSILTQLDISDPNWFILPQLDIVIQSKPETSLLNLKYLTKPWSIFP